MFTAVDLDNAGRIVSYRAPVPAPCTCGVEHVYYIDGDKLIAECGCRKQAFTRETGWGPLG